MDVGEARRSWVLRGDIHFFSEEARTSGFAPLALARFAFFVLLLTFMLERIESVNSGLYLAMAASGQLQPFDIKSGQRLLSAL